VFELRKLDLQLAFMRARALGEDIEDQPGAIDHATLRELLEIALLHRRKRVIDEDQIGVGRLFLFFQFPGLAAADEKLRIRPFDARAQRADDTGSGGTGKLTEFG
jgi:hypothetical protein